MNLVTATSLMSPAEDAASQARTYLLLMLGAVKAGGPRMKSVDYFYTQSVEVVRNYPEAAEQVREYRKRAAKLAQSIWAWHPQNPQGRIGSDR